MIAPGRVADFVTIDSSSARTVGSKSGELVYTATSSDIGTVVVNGRVIVRDGHHALGNPGQLMRRALLAFRGQPLQSSGIRTHH